MNDRASILVEKISSVVNTDENMSAKIDARGPIIAHIRSWPQVESSLRIHVLSPKSLGTSIEPQTSPVNESQFVHSVFEAQLRHSEVRHTTSRVV